MPVLQIAGGGFVIDQNGLSDGSPFVYSSADAIASPGPYPLLIVADVVDAVPGAEQVAGDIVRGMAMVLRHASVDDPRQALLNAFTTANERVLAENSGLSGMRRLYLGLTCVVVRGNELYVAQCAPSQLLVWQDGQQFALPDLSTWSARDVTGTFASFSFPLGFQREVQPRISYSRCAPGDVISAVSWQLAQHLYDGGALDGDSAGEEFQHALADVRPGSPARHYHGAIYRIVHGSPAIEGKIADIQGHRPGQRRHSHSGTVSVTQPLPDLAGANGTAFAEDSGSETRSDLDTLVPEHSSEYASSVASDSHAQSGGSSGGANFVELGSKPEHFSESLSSPFIHAKDDSSINSITHPATVRADKSRRSHARKGHNVEIFAGLLLSLSAAVVGVWQVTKRDRPIHGPRDDGTLGLPHLQRWSDTYHRPRFERVRRVSPRFQIHGFLLVGVVIAVAALASVFVFNQLSDRAAGVTANVEERLQEISAVRAQTDVTVPTESGYESLTSAQVVLNELAAESISDEMSGRVQEEQAAVATALNELTSTEELGNVQVLGSIPAAAEGVTERLFSGNGSVYVFSDALYELDQVSSTLVKLLAPGDVVAGEPVGTLLAAAWNDDRPIVADSHNVYMRDPADGRWHRVSIGTLSDDGYASITAMAAFDRNLYFLTAESGQILKFEALDFSVPPEDWAASSAREQLQTAVDLYIDGSIHVVLKDGQVLTFFRSALERTLDATIIPELGSVSALTTVRDGEYYFMIDAATGRIAGIDAEGELYKQFTPSPDTPTLQGATDLVVNESNGITYVVANSTLYAVRITVPPPVATTE